MDDNNSNASQNADGGTGNGAGAAAATKPTWTEQLPEAMRSDETLYQYKTIGDLVTDYKAKSEALTKGDGSIKVPGENATAEEKAAFNKAIGIPETADAYQITKPEGYPEEVPYDVNLEAAYKQVALEHHLPKSAAEGLWKWYQGLVLEGAKQQAAATKTAQEASVNALKDQWGVKFTENAEVATRAFKKFGVGSETLLDKTVDGVRLGDHPGFLKLFHAIGSVISDDVAAPGAGSIGAGEPDAEKLAEAMFPSMAKK